MTVVLLLTLVGRPSGLAQSGIGSPQADVEWNALRDSVKPLGYKAPNAPDLSREAIAAKYLQDAASLKDFQTRNPNHPTLTDAKVLEVLCRHWAALNGAVADDSRRIALTDELRGNKQVLELKRFEIIAWAKQVDVSRQNFASAGSRLVAQESLTRALISEFPAVSIGYESLLSIGRRSPPDRGKIILADLIKLKPPARVSTAAESWLAQLKVVGTSLKDAFIEAGDAAIVEAPNDKVVILYTWSANSLQNWSYARKLIVLAPSAIIIGVNVDSDASQAQAIVARERLPGLQYNVKTKSGGSVAAKLGLKEPRLIYITDRKGVIVEINPTDRAREVLASVAAK